MSSAAINFSEKLAMFTELWSPRVVAEMNDYQFKLVKVKGDFVWHDHQETDEVFVVLKGTMHIAFRDRDVQLSAGEMYVVPKGVEHKPYADEECHMLLVEPRSMVNTGEAGGELQAKNDLWIQQGSRVLVR